MADEKSNLCWKYLEEIGKSERHFNNIQAKYRLLASTWLLASFTGIGFVLTNQCTLPKWELILIAITAGGSIGVTLIWVLDILGYHRLLGANFIEGLRIEHDNPYLPQVRHVMLKLGTVGKSTRLFYFICSISPIAMGAILLLESYLQDGFSRLRLAGLICSSIIISIILIVRMKAEDPTHQKEYLKYNENELKKLLKEEKNP